MKIEINKLLKIVFDVKDFDENLPSVQFEVRIDVQNFAYNLCAESSFWFECRIFDEFIKDMQKNQCAVLRISMSPLKLSLTRIKKSYSG
ncbi:hypothetical protein MHZ90_09290 [Pantoea sp. ACRSH]|uniref:hypothetical protein n=1 Tax=unclassified Pantoea TaxID=2630326 RepID=UPI001EF482E8|nr:MULTISPECIES: hypothetical protein [unclassified Pantoea]MCG7366330.1 hypothetical protein [Pantoea sp. ACRSH]MCG7396806.1 hypothetical protein [Pantoea sp. ACRSC]